MMMSSSITRPLCNIQDTTTLSTKTRTTIGTPEATSQPVIRLATKLGSEIRSNKTLKTVVPIPSRIIWHNQNATTANQISDTFGIASGSRNFLRRWTLSRRYCSVRIHRQAAILDTQPNASSILFDVPLRTSLSYEYAIRARFSPTSAMVRLFLPVYYIVMMFSHQREQNGLKMSRQRIKKMQIVLGPQRRTRQPSPVLQLTRQPIRLPNTAQIE